MRDGGLEGASSDQVRVGLRVSAVSIGWTALSSITAIALGIGGSSVVLTAFGLTGLLDGVGSVALVAHFRHALKHDSFSASHERRALRLITFGLFAVGTLAAVESARRLVGRVPSRAVPAGVVLAGVSVVVLAALSQLKRRTARRIPSRALLADGWLSGVGCLLAIETIAGTGLTLAFGWWWVDPVAATTVGCGAIAIAAVMARSVPPPSTIGAR